MLDSPDLKGRRTDTSSDDIWQQEKVLERFCNHAGDAGRDDDEHDGIRTDASSDDNWQQEKVGILCNLSLVMMTMGIFRSRRRWWCKCLRQL